LKGGEKMNGLGLICICLVPAAMLGVILACGEKLIGFFIEHCEPLRLWAEKQIDQIEAYQEEEE
jgi:hypothetical protein